MGNTYIKLMDQFMFNSLLRLNGECEGWEGGSPSPAPGHLGGLAWPCTIAPLHQCTIMLGHPALPNQLHQFQTNPPVQLIVVVKWVKERTFNHKNRHRMLQLLPLLVLFYCTALSALSAGNTSLFITLLFPNEGKIEPYKFIVESVLL